MDRVSFINIEEDDKDLIISFALDEDGGLVRSLILHRTLFFENLLPEEERGTKVSLEREELGYEQHHLNTLEAFEFAGTTLRIKSRFGQYEIDARKLDSDEFKAIKQALDRQNYDNHFQIEFK